MAAHVTLSHTVHVSIHVAARKASQVLGILGLTSYAGFITVDEQYNSNMYFWFFKAQV